MKRLGVVFFTLITLLNIGCFEDSEDTPATVLSVHVTYTGGRFMAGDMIWVDVYDDADGLKNQDYYYCYGGLGTDSTSDTLTDTIDPGTYYLIAYLDEDGSDWLETGEVYEIYENTTKSGTPTPVTITEGTTTIDISFGDSNIW